MSIVKHRYESGDTDGWLTLRSSMADKLGGSEIGTVAGHSSYCSPFTLFCQKVGAISTPILKKREAIIQGHDGEEGVALRFQRELGKRVHRENCIYTNDQYPHLKASIDRKITGEESGLECKTAKDMAMKKYKHGDFPMSYFDQCLLYLAVTGMERWYLAIQVFGTAFRIFMMTTIKDEADRYNELKEKFIEWENFKSRNYLAWTWDKQSRSFKYEGDDGAAALEVPENIVALIGDADLDEWEDKWCKLEAVYYVDGEEFVAAENLAKLFYDRIVQVQSMMKDWKPEGSVPDDERVLADMRRAALLVAVRQVWPQEEIDGSESTSETVELIAPEVVVDSVVTMDEASPAVALVARRAELKEQIKSLEKEVDQIDNQVSVSIGAAETMKLPGWKVTYKMGTPRETASVSKVKEYFANKGMEVPLGMITISDPSRSLRFYSQSEKAKKAKK